MWATIFGKNQQDLTKNFVQLLFTLARDNGLDPVEQRCRKSSAAYRGNYVRSFKSELGQAAFQMAPNDPWLLLSKPFCSPLSYYARLARGDS